MTDTLSIDSLERMGFIETYFLYLTGDRSQQHYNLDNPLTNVISVEVNSALIPRSEYTVEPERNTLFIYDTQIVLDNRDYDSEDLIAHIISKSSTIHTIDIEVIEGTGRFLFYSNAEFSLDMEKSTCRRILGFDNDYYVSTLAGSRYEISAPFRYNLMGTECILMESDLDSQINHSKLNKISAPLAKFYVSDSSRSQFVQLINHEQGSRHFFPVSKLSRLDITFKRGHIEPGSESHKTYDFHGISYYVHVVVKCISYGKNWGNLGAHRVSNDAEYVLKGLIEFLIKEKEKEKSESNLKEQRNPSNIKGNYGSNYLKTFGLMSAVGLGYWGYTKMKPGGIGSGPEVGGAPVDFDF